MNVRTISLFPCVLFSLLVVNSWGDVQSESDASSETSPLFSRLDFNGDRSLTELELLEFPDLDEDHLTHRMLVFDQNRDGELSLAEFLTIPEVVPNNQRGSLPDPVASWAEPLIDQILRNLKVPVAAGELSAEWKSLLPAFIPLDALLWDLNADRVVDADEAWLGLEKAYGLRRDDGKPSRRPSGIVFNGSYFEHLDQNDDQQLSRTEFVEMYFTGRDQAEMLFQAADTDGSDTLTFDELDASGLLWTDVSAGFLMWDRNHDGAISAEELKRGKPWQIRLSRHVLPAFDQNGDGSISLEEYQFSPLGNPLVNWTSLRSDENADGLLARGEFLKSDSLVGTGLADRYFSLLDLNRNGHLELNEFSFHVEESRLSPETLLSLRDRNGDGQLSVLEVLAPLGGEPPVDQSQVLIPKHLTFFDDVDSDADGLITGQEFLQSPSLHGLGRLEQQLRQQVLPQFEEIDEDSNGKISQEEWLRSEAASKRESRLQPWVICDFDSDQQLSFTEFACLPGMSTQHLRPAVADPVLEELRRARKKLEKQFPADRPNASQLALALKEVVSDFSEADLIGWDINRDGIYQFAEVQRGLEILFGVRDATGLPLRRPNGQVFNRRSWRDADRDDDQALSYQEFMAAYWKHGAAAEDDFLAADINRNNEIELLEALRSDLYWIDTLLEFERFDSDRDGFVSEEELTSQSRPHEKRMVHFSWPAFDRNRDGRFSFVEFRLSPLANPVHDYNARRWDINTDGRLSLAEFHRGPETARVAVGLSQLYLNRLDRDHDGSLEYGEFRFSADLKREPIPVLFEMLDLNSDRQLLLEELLTREKPRDRSDWAQRRAEQRAMEVEDAFFESDSDGNRALSLAEFQNADAPIRDVVLGLSPEHLQDGSSAGDHRISWRVVALIAFNVCLFVGVVWWLRR